MRPVLGHPRLSVRVWRAWYALAPALIVVGISIPGIAQGAFRTDSHVYTAVALRMVESGDWIRPMLGDSVYHNKPPLVFWLVAPFVGWFGPEVWAVRIPMILCAGVSVWAGYMLFKEVARRRVAMTAAIVLALTHEVFRYTHAFSLDLPLLACLTLAAWSVAHSAGVRRGEARSGWWIALGGVALGAALMIKPLVGLLIVPILGVWLGAIGRWRLTVWLIAMVAVGALAALPWHIAMHLAYPPGSEDPFLAHYLGSESLQRLQGGGYETEPVWYYAQELAETYWPWLLCVVGALAMIVIGRRPVTGRWAGDLLALLWAGVWLAVITVSADKSMRYATPAYPALSLLAGGFLATAFPARRKRRARLIPIVLPPAMAVAATIVAFTPLRIHPGPAPERQAMFEFLDQYSGGSTADWPQLWISPEQLRDASYFYLERGVYPAVASSPQAPTGGVPSAGDLMLYRMQDPSFPEGSRGWYVPREGDTLLGHFGLWTVTRLESSWTGEYATRRGRP